MKNSGKLLLLIFLVASISRTVFADNDGMIPDLPVVNEALSMQEAIRLGQQSNIGVLEASSDVKAALAAASSAMAQTMPAISTTTYGLAGDSNNIAPSSPGVSPENFLGVSPHGFADQNIVLMAPLITGGKLQGQVGSKRAQSASAALTFAQAKLAIQGTVTTGYVDTLLKISLVQVAQDRLNAEDEQVRVTQENVSTGKSASVDLLREEAEDAEAKQALLSAQNDVALDLIQLKTTLGISQQSNITLTDNIDTLNVDSALPRSLNVALQTAESNSPELASAVKLVAASRQNVRSSLGSFSPQIYALGMADSSPLSNGGGRVGYTVGLTASIPLFDGGQRRDDVNASKAQLEHAVLVAESVRQTVDQNTESAWLNLNLAGQQVETAQDGVADAKRAYDLETLRYNAGKSVDAERLDSLSALTRAKSVLSMAMASVIETKVNLLVAIGTTL